MGKTCLISPVLIRAREKVGKEANEPGSWRDATKTCAPFSTLPRRGGDKSNLEDGLR